MDIEVSKFLRDRRNEGLRIEKFLRRKHMNLLIILPFL